MARRVFGGQIEENIKEYSWIVPVILVCIVLSMIILVIVNFIRGNRHQKRFWKLTRNTPYKQKLIWNDLPKSMTYNEYTITCSFKISDWEYNYDKPKCIFYRGKQTSEHGLIINPGVWVYPKTASLMVRISNLNKKCQPGGCNFKNSKVNGGDLLEDVQLKEDSLYSCQQQCLNYTNIDDGNAVFCDGINYDPLGGMPNCKLYSKGGSESYYPRTYDSDPNNLLNYSANTYKQCDIKGIPIQKWINLTLVYFNNQLDVYIDGILQRSCSNIVSIPFELKGADSGITNRQLEPYGIVVNPEFKGQIKDMKYFDYSLNSNQINSMFGIRNAKLMQNIPKFI